MTRLGRALYRIAHADGWHSSGQTEGLRRTVGSVVVVGQADTFEPEPDQWPEHSFDVEGELRHRREDFLLG